MKPEEKEVNSEAMETKPLKRIKVAKKNSKDMELIKKLQLENDDLNDKLLRISAEMQNMKRRNSEELSKMLRYDGEEFIKKILPSVDNFERALDRNEEDLSEETKNFLDGIKMIYSSLLTILKDYQITEIVCLNEEFDPTFMNAVLTDCVEGVKANIVIDVLQKGYLYKEKVIRPAMVKVSE